MPGKLAALVRAKYPGAYDDLSDADLEKSVLAKHPEYQDLATPPPAPVEPKRTWTDVAVDALPAIGGAIGGAVGNVPGAVLGGAGGEAYRQLIQRARGNPTAGTMTDAAKDIGIEGGFQGAFEGAGRAVQAAVTPAAKAVYRGYLKPSLSRVNIGKAAEIVDTAFRENLPVTHGAVAEAGRRIGELKAKVDQLLAQSTGDVNLGEIANRVRVWANGMFNRAGRSPDDLTAALKVADRIDSHPSMLAPGQYGPPNPIVDLTTANQVKRDLQAGVGTSQYGIPSAAAKTAEKVGARETRLAIEGQVPEVGALNMRESNLIDLARSVRSAVEREANQSQIHGVKTLLSLGVGGEEYQRTGDPLTAATKALALRVGLHPAVATRAALIAARIANRVPGTAVADVARAAVQAVSESQY